MRPVANSTDVLRPPTLRTTRSGARPPAARGAAVLVEDGARYRTIGSTLALIAAIAASLLVTGLLRLVL